MNKYEWRATWVGTGIAVVLSIILAVVAHAIEPTINGPGSRSIAPPVLWAIGGGIGLSAGAFVASLLTGRWLTGAQAALLGGVAFLVLVILAYNDKSLRLEDQIVGTLIVVVLGPFLVALLAAWVGKVVSRLLHRQTA
jgi:hypothetical protein